MFQRNKISKTCLLFAAALILICIALSIMAFVGLIKAYDDFTGFFLLQLGIPLVPIPVISSDGKTVEPSSRYAISIYQQSYIVVCTNLTLEPSSEMRKFKGETIAVRQCDPTSNPCEENVCTVNGTCIPTLVDGAECSTSNFICSGNRFCNNSCQCQTFPSTSTGCLEDSDCIDVSDRGNNCSTSTCVMARCVETTVGECWLDEQCNTGGSTNKTCNTNSCTCEDIPFLSCLIDDDCPDISDRGNCSTNLCINNKCVETTQGLGECWMDGQCNQTSQICDTNTCGCIPKPPTPCQLDTDCNDVSDRTCSTFICVVGECIETILGGAECWINTQCLQPFEYCDGISCTCQPVPLEPPCTTDDQCLDISNRTAGGCVANQCINATCQEVTIGECWFDQDCVAGLYCNPNTCTCESPQTACFDGYDIRALPVNQAFFNLTCGLGVSITQGTYAQELCFYDDPFGNDFFAITSSIKSSDTWTYVNFQLSTVSFTSVPPAGSAMIRADGLYVVFIGTFFDQALPQSKRAHIFELSAPGLLSLVQTIILPATNTSEICIDISGTDIVVVNEVAYIYRLTSPTTWTLNQTIQDANNLTYFDCDLYGDTLVLSTVPDVNLSTITWYSYLSDGATFNEVGSYTNTLLDDNWYVASLQNNLVGTGYDFTVMSSPSSPPVSTVQITASGGQELSGYQFITSNGPGVIASYDKNFVISDILFLNSMTNSFNFQTDIGGRYVIGNDIWDDQPIFLATNSTTPGYPVAYVNYCP